MPEEAKEDSKEGAKRFVKYYVEVLNLAQATGEIQTLSKLSSADCVACQRTIRSLETLYAKGGQLTGGAWKVSGFVGVRDETSGNWLITTRASYSEQKSVTPGQPTSTFTGGSAAYDFLVAPAPGRKVLKWSRVT